MTRIRYPVLTSGDRSLSGGHSTAACGSRSTDGAYPPDGRPSGRPAPPGPPHRHLGGPDGILGSEDVVTVGVDCDPFPRLTGVMSQDLLHLTAQEGNLAGLVLDVDRLALGSAVGLMDQHPGVRQHQTLSCRSAGQEHRRA
jgi:hypothetical protein